MQLPRIGSQPMPVWKAPRPASPEPPAPPSKPEFRADQLKLLSEIRHPGSTSLEDRLNLARSLTDVLSQDEAVRAARFLVELSSGKSGCNYVSDHVEIEVKHRARPLEVATRQFREMLAFLQSGRTSGNKAGQVELSLGITTCVLADEPAQAELFKSLLHDYGNPHTAYLFLQKLTALPEERRTPAREAIERLYSFDDKGEPRRWGPPQNWLQSSLRLLFMASLLEPGQPFSDARQAVDRLGPRIDALQAEEKKVFSSYKPRDESFEPSRNYRDPSETPLAALERQLDLIDRVARKGLKVVDQRHSVSNLSHKLDRWRELLPGQSTDQILRGVVDEILATDIPASRMAPLFYRLDTLMQPGESPRQCLDRVAANHEALTQRFGVYGEKALDEAFRFSLDLPASTPMLLADLADRFAARNTRPEVSEFGFFSSALKLSQQGLPPDRVVAELELDRALTGSFGGRQQLQANLNWLQSEKKLTPDRRAEIEAELPGWLAAFRLDGASDPGRKLMTALGENPLAELLPDSRPETRAVLPTAMSEVFRLGKRLGYPQEPLLEMLRAALREAGPEGALALPALLEELEPEDKLPAADDLVDLVRSTVADPDEAHSLKERLERAARSFYLTGSYNGMRQAREKLQVWQDTGALRRDVPFCELQDALERHLVQLRVLGTPPEKTVEQALAALKASEYGGEGQISQTLGMIGEKLAVGAVPIKIRRSR